MGNGRWVGHPGYAGQFLKVSPQKSAAIAFYSVCETAYGDQAGYFDEIIAVLERMLERL